MFPIGIAFALILIGTVTAADAPIPVEIWRGGDDGSTVKLYDALESAFNSSPEFTVTSAGNGTLIVTIQNHVEVRRKFWRKRIYYNVEFATKNNQQISQSQGSCWKSSVTKCANDVLKDAKSAATKLSREKQ